MPGPRQEGIGKLECGYLFADDEDPLARVGLRRSRVGVVRDVLHPGDVRLPRLGDAEGEHGDRAAVRAVGRLEREAIALALRTGPSRAIPDLHAGVGRERGEVLLHLGARREVRRAVHQAGLDRAQAVLFADERVPVVALVVARATLFGRERLRPRQEALEEWPAAEHAAWRGIGGDDRVLDAGARQRVAELQPARAAADDDDRVFAGRERAVG